MTAASCFSAAADHYDHHAEVQRWAGDLLLQRCQSAPLWLDIGCGTGYLSERLPGQQVIGVDIAMAMLRHCTNPLLLQADMQAIPLANASVDAVGANLSMQWSDNLSVALQQAARVCRGDGQLRLTVPAAGTFPELLPLIATGQLACNQFLSATQLKQAATNAGWRNAKVVSHTVTLYFDSPKSLLQHFKFTGAQHAKRQAGLRGRRWWQGICTHLQTHHTEHGLPLTWQIHLLEAQR